MKKILFAILILLGSIAAQAQTSPEMYRRGAGLKLDGERLSSSQVQALIGDYNYNNTYRGARTQYITGATLLSTGAVISGFGIALMASATVDFIDNDEVDAAELYLSVGVTAVGELLLAAGAPLFCIGKSRLNWIADDYNKNPNKSAVSLSFGPQKSGVGLAVRF